MMLLMYQSGISFCSCAAVMQASVMNPWAGLWGWDCEGWQVADFYPKARSRCTWLLHHRHCGALDVKKRRKSTSEKSFSFFLRNLETPSSLCGSIVDMGIHTVDLCHLHDAPRWRPTPVSAVNQQDPLSRQQGHDKVFSATHVSNWICQNTRLKQGYCTREVTSGCSGVNVWPRLYPDTQPWNPTVVGSVEELRAEVIQAQTTMAV